jgi:hypothetical protein
MFNALNLGCFCIPYFEKSHSIILTYDNHLRQSVRGKINMAIMQSQLIYNYFDENHWLLSF